MWATDASYFKVIGWGYYYLVTVMEDYSRFILSWKLQRDMTTDSLIEVVQEAVDKTGMTEVPVADRTSLLSDNGSGYLSRGFRDYLRLVGIKHIRAAPSHPQTNGILPMVALARQEGYHTAYVPAVDAAEAALVEGMSVMPVSSLEELLAHFRDERFIAPYTPSPEEHPERSTRTIRSPMLDRTWPISEARSTPSGP